MKKPFPAPRYADTLDNRTIALEINCYDGPTNDERMENSVELLRARIQNLKKGEMKSLGLVKWRERWRGEGIRWRGVRGEGRGEKQDAYDKLSLWD